MLLPSLTKYPSCQSVSASFVSSLMLFQLLLDGHALSTAFCGITFFRHSPGCDGHRNGSSINGFSACSIAIQFSCMAKSVSAPCLVHPQQLTWIDAILCPRRQMALYERCGSGLPASVVLAGWSRTCHPCPPRRIVVLSSTGTSRPQNRAKFVEV